MRLLIVEDEEHTRAELVYLLAKLAPELTLLEAGNAAEALASAAAEPPDAAFLDINLPGQSGLALAADLLTLEEPPQIVFSTAATEHAVQAFELSALDYIVKPYRETRIAETLGRLRKVQKGHGDARAAQASLQTYLQHAPDLKRLWAARPGGGGVLLSYAEVCWLEANGKQVDAFTLRGDRYALKRTLRDLEASLAPHGFVRTHKSYLVNIAHVTELEPWFSGAYRLRLNDAARSSVPLSRQYAKQLKLRTGWL